MIGLKAEKRKFEVEGSSFDGQNPDAKDCSNKKSMAIASPPVKLCPSPILKLNIDCFIEIFDYLTLDDLIAIGHTCKRLQRVVGYFIQQYFSAKRKTYQNANIYMDWTPRYIGMFTEFLESVYIFGNFSSAYQYVGANCTTLLRELRLAQVDLTTYEVECIKSILPGLEVVEMVQCSFNNEFYDHFLQFCPKLKRLSVSRSSYNRDGGTIVGCKNNWLHRKYPMLEHLELTNLYELKQNELQIFFGQNPNCRTFSIDAKSLILNRDSILASNVKLDQLAIEFHPQAINSDIEPAYIVNLFYSLLVELHKRGFFNKLHLYVNFLDHQNCLQKLISLNPLTMLSGYVNHIENPLICLKELNITEASDVVDIQILPDKLPNIERIHFSIANSDHILPFIRCSPRLRQMKIENLMDGVHLVDGVLDLMELNKERIMLEKAKKVTIYVNERVYVATKWSKWQMQLKLIEVKRGESFEWKGLNSTSKFVRSF